jgi:hypothetical protein
MGTITFRTAEQAAIFKLELTGQFSDGLWENTYYPRDHWHPWSDAKVEVGPNVGRDFHAEKDNYNVAAKALLEVVGERMKGFARIAKVLGLEAARELGNHVDWDTGRLDRPTYGIGDAYWDNKRADFDRLLAKHGQYAFDRINDRSLYEDKHLRADLREIKKAMKTRIG